MTAVSAVESIADLVEQSGRDLLALAAAVAARPELWRDRVEHDPDGRTFTRLFVDGDVEVWVLGWCRGQSTGLHDHDGSAGAVSVVEGMLVEDLLRADEAGKLLRSRVRRISGTSFAFDGGRIHAVSHVGSAPATSIHVYSPPIDRMGSYEVGTDGSSAERLSTARLETEAQARSTSGPAERRLSSIVIGKHDRDAVTTVCGDAGLGEGRLRPPGDARARGE